MPTRFIIALLFAILATSTPSAVAWRSPGPLSEEAIIAASPWIFAGRLVRYELHPGDIIGGPSPAFYTAVPGLILRGNPPKTLRLYGRVPKPPTTSNLFIFYVDPSSSAPGFDGLMIDLQPYSTEKLKKTKALIQQNPPRPQISQHLKPPSFQ